MVAAWINADMGVGPPSSPAARYATALALIAPARLNKTMQGESDGRPGGRAGDGELRGALWSGMRKTVA